MSQSVLMPTGSNHLWAVQVKGASLLHAQSGIAWEPNSGTPLDWTLSGVNRHLYGSVVADVPAERVNLRGAFFLAYNNQYRNAYHILMEWARALFTYRELGLASLGCRILLPSSHAENHYLKALLQYLDLSRLVSWVDDQDASSYIHVEQLVVPKCLFSDGFDYVYPAFMVDWFAAFRSWILRLDSGRLRRKCLYVSRRDTTYRRVANEAALESSLRAKGFEVLELSKCSLTAIVQAFSEAEVVVAPHGAGLANLVFHQAPRLTLELMPSTYVNPCFRVISEGLSDPHDYIIMRELVADANHRNRVFEVDLGEVSSYLKSHI